MSLPDYYKALEISPTATSVEIKAAYRRLAKLYHPDKNHGNLSAEEKFKQIKEAYETLINTPRRRKYDEKRNRSLTGKVSTTQKKPSQKKNYDFTDEEAKRRKYYQQHYKTKTAPPKSQPAVKTKPAHTEIKYILISVPIAVALLLLMIRIYEKPKNNQPVQNIISDSISIKTPVAIGSEINTPESPYRASLGDNMYDSTTHNVIKLVNKTGYDAIIFLQDDSNKVIRHHFIENNYRLILEHLPLRTYHLSYWLGKEFSYKNILFNDIIGSFSETVCIDTLAEKIKLNSDTLTLALKLNKTSSPNTILLRNIFGNN